MRFVTAIAVAGLASACGAQSISYNLTGMNLTSGGGLGTMQPGDVLRIFVSADFSNPTGAMSLGLASFDIAIEQRSGAPSIALIETSDADANFDLNGPETGRHPHMRNAASDRPNDQVNGASVMALHNTAPGLWTLSDAAGDGIDLATFAPTFNPLIALFPISSRETFFVFDYVYESCFSMSIVPRGAGRIFRNPTDGNGVTVPNPLAGTRLICPSPPSLIVCAGAGTVMGPRRRRPGPRE